MIDAADMLAELVKDQDQTSEIAANNDATVAEVLISAWDKQWHVQVTRQWEIRP